MKKRKSLRFLLEEYSSASLMLVGVLAVTALTFAHSGNRTLVSEVNIKERKYTTGGSSSVSSATLRPAAPAAYSASSVNRINQRRRPEASKLSSESSSDFPIPFIPVSSASAPVVLPDYFVYSMAVETRSDGKVNVFAVIKNRGGNSPITSFSTLQISLSGTGPWTTTGLKQPVPALPQLGGESEAAWEGVGPFPAGNHRMRVCADSTSVIQEANHANNCSAPLPVQISTSPAKTQ